MLLAPQVLMTSADYKLGAVAAKLDNFFRISDRGSSFWLEFSGGMTTFFSMCYIMVLNGIIIGGYFNTGIPVNGVFFATALTAGVFTFLMGLFVKRSRPAWASTATSPARPSES